MKNKFTWLALFIFVLITNPMTGSLTGSLTAFLNGSLSGSLNAVDDSLPMSHLKEFADGLNIEGGTIFQKYLRKEQIWSNLCVVLDRPFMSGIEWQELNNINTFPLKEATIPDYNEAQVNFAYATILHYYITHAHQMSNKPMNQIAKILIQVHRNSSGPYHVKLLKELIDECYPELHGYVISRNTISKYELSTCYLPNENVIIYFCYGVSPENLGDLGLYNDKDIVLSFSLVAGFHPDWKSGSLIYSSEYIPFSLKTVYLELENKYYVTNHLKQALKDIIESQEDAVLKKVNEMFYSLNPQKHSLKAKKLTFEDFKNATLLQVDGIFNPSQLPPNFQLNRPQS